MGITNKLVFTGTLAIALFSFFTPVHSQEDVISIVAVGEAQKEKEVVLIKTSNELKSLTVGEKAKVQELVSLIENDFKFYRHLFEVKLASDPSEKEINDSTYLITLEFVRKKLLEKNEVLQLKYGVSSQSAKLSYTNERAFELDRVRDFGHEIADTLYREITGKESIFTSKILFLSDRTSRPGEQAREVYMMDFDGHGKQRVTFNNTLVISPAISPDGKQILYTAIESRWEGSGTGRPRKVQNLNLYLMDLRTQKRRVISNVKGMNSGAIFNHDGSEIYLTLSHQKNADIYRMNVQTSAKSRLTNHFLDDVDPHINSSGDLMTFLSGRSGKAMIYVMDPKGAEKDVKRISYVGKFNASPRFSPDGKEIVFASWVDDRFDIYKIDSNGNNLVRLTKDFGSNEEPWFSPDGQFIVFTSQRVISRKKAVQNIYIMNRDGEIISQITQDYGKTFTPRWFKSK